MKKSTIAATLLTLGALVGCSDPETSSSTFKSRPAVVCDTTVPADTLEVVSLNMDIGFPVERLFLINLDDSDTVFEQTTQVLDTLETSLPRQRMRLQAQTLARIAPDVIALQEVLHMERGGYPSFDFLDTLLADLRTAGSPEYQILFKPLNRVQRSLRHSSGRILSLHFWEGNALLWRKNRLLRTDSATFLYQNLLHIKVLGDPMSSERAALWGRFQTARGSFLQVFNTHLETEKTAAQRNAQASELLFVADSLRRGGESQILLGDFNARSTEIPILKAREDGFLDAATMARDSTPTCCVDHMRSGLASHDRRIDYILAQGVCQIPFFNLDLNRPIPQPDGSTLFPSDHALLQARLILRPR